MSSIDTLFIAEKPSLAQAVAEARAEQLGVRASKGDGMWSVGPDAVTWLVGHLYDQAQPADYGERWAKWSLDALPIVLEDHEWKLVPDEKHKPHLRKIQQMIRSAKKIGHVGDAAREGQLIVGEVIQEAGVDPHAPNVLRLWVRSVARKDLLAALSDMKPNAERRNLHNAAVCRQRADWQHGMTYSRLYTLLARNSGVDAKISVGRVQTPTLRLVVDRDRERIRFKAVDHYLPKIAFRHENGSFAATWVIPQEAEGLDSEGRLVDKAAAERVVAKIAGKPGKVATFKAETKFKAPPLPYSLPTLQAEAGTRFGLTAQEVLDIAQALYEQHKATTYPRTDSRHLPSAIFKDEAPGIVQALCGTEEIGTAAKGADMSLRSGAWDDSKVSDHHGIIPTSEFSASKLARMSDIERKVFLMIARAFVAQFHPPFKYKAISTEVACEGEKFKATGRIVLDQGWKSVYGAGEAEDEEDVADTEGAQNLPTMAQGDAVHAEKGELLAKRTTPPPAFSDPTLITAMTNIHRFEPNAEFRKQLRDGDGIGTTATRAAIIETNLKRGFLKRKGKNGLESTELGRSVIDALPEDMTRPALTAIWERALGQVEKGEMDPSKFMSAQAENIRQRVEASRGTTITVKGAPVTRPIEGHGEQCPKCQKGTLVTREVRQGEHKGKKYLSCTSYPSCNHSQWPQARVEPIDGHGKACPDCGTGKMLTRQVSGKKDPKKKYVLLACSNYPECKRSEWPEPKVEELPGHGKDCPQCGKGKLNTREVTSKKDGKKYRLLACSNYPQCSHGEWPDRPPQAEVPPLPGHGKDCPQCRKGKLLTKQITAKTGKTHVLLSCNAYPACKHGEWPDREPQGDVDPLPGHGKDCAECRKGKMMTKEIPGKDGKRHKLLSCNAYPACRNSEWPDRDGGAGGSARGGTASRGGTARAPRDAKRLVPESDLTH